MRAILVTIGALLGLALASGGAGAGYYYHSEYCSTARAYYPPHPASDFSAYYYQSPGGIGRARSRQHGRGVTK